MKKFIFLIILVFIAAATTLTYHYTQAADINYYKAHRYFEKSQYNKAIQFYEETLAHKPSHINALKELGYSYQWTGRYPEAITTFQKYLLYKPKDNNVKESLAETYAWNKNYQRAIALYEEILKDKNGNAAIDRKLAEVFLWSGQYDKAINIAKNQLKENPKDIKIKLILAKALHYSDNTKDAAFIFKEILSDKTARLDRNQEEEIKKLLGEAYMIEKDYKNSIEQYRAILEQNPQDTKTRLALADILSWQKNYDECINEYLKVLEAEPNNFQAKEKLANVYLWKKDYKNAESLFKEIIKSDPENVNVKVILGQMLLWQGRNTEAVTYFEEVLANDKRNLKAMESLADVLSYKKEFNRSIFLYKEILKQKKDLDIEEKLAAVLSWARQYKESLKLYDEILSEKENFRIRLQKARVLGWAKDYNGSLKEYKKILDNQYDALVELEMKSKKAYWNNRIKTAIEDYNTLIEKDPTNIEAMFDLSQIYAHNQMWKEAIGEFSKILSDNPEHFRAKEGLQKVKLISEHISLKSGYEFREADSQSRDMDVRKHSIANKLNCPIGSSINVGFEDKITTRIFSDFKDVLQNEVKLSASYIQNPSGWVEGFYGLSTYDNDIDNIQYFGAKLNIRVFDFVTNTFSYEREPLENSSKVIRENYYSDNFKERIDIDINTRIKAGADYLYQSYSDDNESSEAGFDILYFFSIDPMRLTAKYRYFFRDFNNEAAEYFSPKNFKTNSVEFSWRHYLNKEEIFYGADDLYYEVNYTISRDSFRITTHKFSGGINWDINNKLNLNLQGSISQSSKKVYRDSGFIASVRYYF